MSRADDALAAQARRDDNTTEDRETIDKMASALAGAEASRRAGWAQKYAADAEIERLRRVIIADRSEAATATAHSWTTYRAANVSAVTVEGEIGLLAPLAAQFAQMVVEDNPELLAKRHRGSVTAWAFAEAHVAILRTELGMSMETVGPEGIGALFEEWDAAEERAMRMRDRLGLNPVPHEGGAGSP